MNFVTATLWPPEGWTWRSGAWVRGRMKAADSCAVAGESANAESAIVTNPRWGTSMEAFASVTISAASAGPTTHFVR